MKYFWDTEYSRAMCVAMGYDISHLIGEYFQYQHMDIHVIHSRGMLGCYTGHASWVSGHATASRHAGHIRHALLRVRVSNMYVCVCVCW